MNFLIKHRFFIIIFAGLSLLLGISFILIPNQQTDNISEAATWVGRINYGAYWINTPEETQGNRGGYIPSDKDSTWFMNVGTVSVASYSGTGGEWVSLGSDNKTIDDSGDSWENVSKIEYNVSGSDLFSTKNFTCHISLTATPEKGFEIFKTGGTGSIDITDGHVNFWTMTESCYYHYQVFFGPKLYNVKFNTNGGKFSDGTTSKTVDTRYLEYYNTPSETPTRTGYQFYKWYFVNSYGVNYIEDYTRLEKVNEIYMYAEWKANQYNILFNKNGGTGGTSTKTVSYGEVCPTVTIPTRTGYKFIGYFDSASGGTQYYSADGVGLTKYTTAGNKTLYAQWWEETYKLSFDANGGHCPIISSLVEYGQTYTFPTAVHDGHYFKNWLHNGKEYIGTQIIPDFGADGASITMVAQWEKETYNINYYLDTGQTPNSTESATYGDSLTLPTPTKEGYTFSHWKHRTTGETYSGTITIPDWGDNGTAVPLEAQWTIEKYNLNFDTAGGNTISPMTVTYNGIYDLPIPTRTGYNFKNWTMNTQDISSPWTISDLGNNGDTITLTATWTAIGYTIRFNVNGGSGTLPDLPMTYDQYKTLSNAVKENDNDTEFFIRNNYLFLGWHTDRNATTPLYSNMQSVSNLTSQENAIVNLYAIWLDTWANHYAVPTGSGSKTDPYIISTPQNLAWISWQTENRGSVSSYFTQTANISLSGYEWLPIGNATNTFNGNYNGNGYIITNIKTSEITNVERNNIGLFGYTYGANISNIRLYGEIQGDVNTGSITGKSINTTITNCTNYAKITSSVDAGGISGYFNGTMTACYNYGDVEGTKASGLVSQLLSSTITNSYVKATIRGTNAGGISNYAQLSTISSSAFEGSIYAGSSHGAIIGQSVNSTILNCYAKSTQVVTSNKGMFTGTATMTNCVFEINGNKYYKGTDFSVWVWTNDNRPLPSGLAWLANGGKPISSPSQLTGYTEV